jgi:hypothetical protein
MQEVELYGYHRDEMEMGGWDERGRDQLKG